MQRIISRPLFTSIDFLCFKKAICQSRFCRTYSVLVSIHRRLDSEYANNKLAFHIRNFANLADSALKEPVAEKAPVPKKTEISFEELRLLVDSSTGKIYDVREIDEIKESGMIATAVNLPLSKLKVSLKMEEDDFSKTYSGARPKEQDEIIFYGLSTVKSLSALEIAHKLGFKRARHYPGGFDEWQKKHQ